MDDLIPDLVVQQNRELFDSRNSNEQVVVMPEGSRDP